MEVRVGFNEHVPAIREALLEDEAAKPAGLDAVGWSSPLRRVYQCVHIVGGWGAGCVGQVPRPCEGVCARAEGAWDRRRPERHQRP